MELDYSKLIGHLGSGSAGEVRAVFDDFLRGYVRAMVTDVMAAEVELLCGPRYSPEKSAACRRAGSAPGVFGCETRTESIQRPRVRRKRATGGEEEVLLHTYAAARDGNALQEAVMRALLGGVSSREQQDVYPEGKHISKSSVSRLWIERGAELLAELRGRDLGEEKWLVLMLDGISLSSDLTAVVALGITEDGRKIILDFEVGSSESFDVCADLLNRIKERGFQPVAQRLLAVTDGGKGLRKAIRKAFKHPVLQRCLVHKERNIRAYLSHKYYGKLAALFKTIRNAQGQRDATAALDAIRDFLTRHSKRALESLEEGGDELLAFHALNVPSTLNVSLLSTNCIENPFRNVRRKIGRVQRWRPETDQPERWMASALLAAEKGFRRIKGWRDLGALKDALNRLPAVPITKETAVDRDLILV